jgi:aristolochene synthase
MGHTDLLEDMSFEEGEAYNNQLMPIMQGLVQPNPERPVETMMWNMWEGMRSCDPELADKTLQDTFVFMRLVFPTEQPWRSKN